MGNATPAWCIAQMLPSSSIVIRASSGTVGANTASAILASALGSPPKASMFAREVAKYSSLVASLTSTISAGQRIRCHNLPSRS